MISALHRLIADRAPVTHRLGDLLARHLATANLLGRAQVVHLAHKQTGRKIEIAGVSRLMRFDDNPDDYPVGFSTDMPAEDIAAYLRGLTPVTKDVFDGLTSQYRKDAFTIAGAADVRLIQKVRDELADVAERGGDSRDFQAAVNKLTTDEGVAQINAFTLDVAFNTAMQGAYSLGRYDQMREPGVMAILPYWQYWTVGDARVRPEHRVLQGFTARADDPVWNKIYPPNGFGCRCAVVPILASEAPKDADQPGYERLPMLAQILVPQPGFGKVFAL